MKQIEIKYRPISWVPVERTITGNFPQNWGDLSPDRLLAIVSLGKNQITDLKFLGKMSGIKTSILKCMDEYQLFKLMEMLEFISNRKPHHEFIICKLPVSNCPMLFAPSPKLKGVSFGRFIFADSYFANYQESGNDDDLNKFIAALYLGMNEKFEERLIQERFVSIGKLDMNVRQAIALNYQLIHEWLALAYPLIFQKREEMINDDGTAISRPASDGSPWIKIFQNFVGDDILHDDLWASKPVNTIFAYMTRKYKERPHLNPPRRGGL